jgi:hypothetical protein
MTTVSSVAFGCIANHLSSSSFLEEVQGCLSSEDQVCHSVSLSGIVSSLSVVLLRNVSGRSLTADCISTNHVLSKKKHHDNL